MIRSNAVIQSLLNYIGWFLCIKLASKNQPALATSAIFATSIIQFLFICNKDKKIFKIITLMIIFLVIGILFDSMLLFQKLIIFNSNPFTPWFSPPWMWGIWLSFTLLFYSVFLSQMHRPLLLAALLFPGLLFGYYLGARLGAATLTYGIFVEFPVFLILTGVLLMGVFLYQWIIHISD